MKQLILNIPENKYSFFLELLKKLDFVKVVSKEIDSKSAEVTEERNKWVELAVQGLAKNYSDDEPDYSDVVLMEPNPEYKPWKKVL